MADIAAADVSALVIFRERVNTLASGGDIWLRVGVQITIDPGTTDAYPTSGIPLTNLFTTGNASDTWLDVTQPVFEEGGGTARIDSGLTVTVPAFFYDGAATAAGKVLVFQRAAALPSITASIASVGAPVTSFTDAANGFVTAGFKAGDVVIASGNATAAGNGTALVTAVAAGALTVGATTLTATGAASMTIQTIYRPENAMAEHANTDVTLVGDIAAGDTNIIYRTILLGRLRPTVTVSGANIF